MKNNNLKNLIKLNQTFADAAREHYASIGLTYADVPQIVGITGACENVDTLFCVGSRVKVPLFFSQTGQLSLEQALQHFPGVFTVIHSGRDEEEEDNRHLRQFRLTEEEFDWSLAAGNGGGGANDAVPYDEEKMFESLLGHIEAATKDIARAIATQNADILKEYERDGAALAESLSLPYLRISYEDAVLLLQKHGFEALMWGDDLKAEHEALIVKLLNDGDTKDDRARAAGSAAASALPRPVFITRYPKDIKFFNMKVSEKDPRVVLSADLIFPFAGEGVGSAVREHDGEKLEQRLVGGTMFRLHKERGGNLEDFRWYLDLVRSKTTRPHAGYGIGNERLLQYVLGQEDIRNCSTFHLMAEQTGDWKGKEGLIK